MEMSQLKFSFYLIIRGLTLTVIIEIPTKFQIQIETMPNLFKFVPLNQTKRYN